MSCYMAVQHLFKNAGSFVIKSLILSQITSVIQTLVLVQKSKTKYMCMKNTGDNFKSKI